MCISADVHKCILLYVHICIYCCMYVYSWGTTKGKHRYRGMPEYQGPDIEVSGYTPISGYGTISGYTAISGYTPTWGYIPISYSLVQE